MEDARGHLVQGGIESNPFKEVSLKKLSFLLMPIRGEGVNGTYFLGLALGGRV